MQAEPDYQTYKLLLDLWKSENQIKTIKLQFLLLVNALLVSTVGLAGGFSGGLWFVYAAGVVLNLIWTFSIGRTSLFQDVWQAKMAALRKRYPEDARFSLLASEDEKKGARWIVRALGGMPSRWYLLFSPLGFAAVWLAIWVVTRQA